MDSSELIAGDGSAHATDHRPREGPPPTAGRRASQPNPVIHSDTTAQPPRTPLTPHHRFTLGQQGPATTRRNHRELQEPSGRATTRPVRNPESVTRLAVTATHTQSRDYAGHHDRIEPFRPHHRPMNPVPPPPQSTGGTSPHHLQCQTLTRRIVSGASTTMDTLTRRR